MHAVKTLYTLCTSLCYHDDMISSAIMLLVGRQEGNSACKKFCFMKTLLWDVGMQVGGVESEVLCGVSKRFAGKMTV